MSMTFHEALDDAKQHSGKRHLLLGNGFSIACRPDCFSYGRLLDEADFSNLHLEAEGLFGLLGTSDFERVIESLRIADSLVRAYGTSDVELPTRLAADAEAVRSALAEVLARRHPDHIHALERREYESSRSFLANFDGCLYTVNYDLLLYWSLVQSDLEPEIESDDGFRADEDDPEAPYVAWDAVASHRQRVYYLHGGLHLFDAGHQLRKVTFSRTGVHVVDQIREALATGHYPRVVTEGTSQEKQEAIVHSAYLSRGLRSLSACGGSLFLFGHSLADNDAHVLRAISEGKVRRLYVSLFGNPDSDGNESIRARADSLATARPARRSLTVSFYDAASAEVWTS
jgi:hypothetical protein